MLRGVTYSDGRREKDMMPHGIFKYKDITNETIKK